MNAGIRSYFGVCNKTGRNSVAEVRDRKVLGSNSVVALLTAPFHVQTGVLA
jgi:hypothetical protein